MDFLKCLKEIVSFLYWSMLAAVTIGPGTVVTCARAGAEFELNLIWALVFATIFSYILLEGTARLTITSGKSLGECLQLRYRHGRLIWQVSIFCWVVAGSVFFGNTLYQCNCFAGGMAAIYSLPGAENTHALRISCCIGYGVITVALLFADKVKTLGVGLGLVVVGMVILFLVVVAKLGLDAEKFFKGVVPISMPSGSSNLVLSLIGTTAVGFNLFLGGEMARGKTLGEAQRGIAYSVIMTLVVSILIMIVGQGTYVQSDGKFTIASLAGLIEEHTGKFGIWMYGIGFIAAAFSSMLVVPLASAVTAESVFTIRSTEEKPHQKNDTVSENKENIEKSEVKIEKGNMEMIRETDVVRPFRKLYKNSLMFVMTLIAVIVIAADSPTVQIIQIAQVFNGCLLPFLSICLLVCLNDPEFMRTSPQKWWANLSLVLVVMVALFLTCNTVIQNIFGSLDDESSKTTFRNIKFSVSGAFSLLTMTVLFLCTSLGKQIRNSFRKR